MGFWINKPVVAAYDEDLPKGYIRTKSYLGYTDKKGELWEAPVGTETDGASIPKAFWWIIGNPFSPEYIESAIIHDFACNSKTRSSKAVHAVFEEMLKESPDVPKWKRIAMAFAVKTFGPKWRMQNE